MKKNKLLALLIVTIVIVIGIFGWWANGTSAVNKSDHSSQIFVVRKGEGLRNIAKELQDARLIKDQFIFILLIKQLGLDGNMQAGDYKLTPSLTPEDIARIMTKGSLDVWVTITEGKRASEIAEILQNKIPTYDATWKTKLIEEEGYLFPDTYLFPHDATIEQVLSIMKNNFEKKYAQASQNQTSKLSKPEAVILASIVEREGRSPEGMKMIASVLENRLSIGMALQADATIQYALGNTFNWWPTPTAQNLKIDSPYNTYRNPGLPPTPIANPGLAALNAVLSPANTNYFYYISDSKGVLHFARTLDEQNANIKKFGL